MSTRQKILATLADGSFHSGTALGQELGISRAAVNKAVQALIERGLEIHSISGKGYRWQSPGALLDREKICTLLGPVVSQFDMSIEVLEEIDSTNRYLATRSGDPGAACRVCLAESQTGGRGRRGREWISTPYQNLICSIARRFEVSPASLSGLSLAAGVTIARTLRRLRLADVGLKWPNDLVYQNRKLAGILVDVKGEIDGPTDVVLGFGLNIFLGANEANNIDQPWTDLVSIVGHGIDRNELAAEIIEALVVALAEFENGGLHSFLEDWKQLHIYENRSVRLIQGDQKIHGTVCGIGSDGSLLLDTGKDVLSIHSGEMSLRAG